jgi:hypothetical protein
VIKRSFVLAVALIMAPLASAAARPQQLINPGSWLQHRAAPAGTLKQGERAMTGLELTIASDGSVSACDVIVPSRIALLDEYACSLFQTNARYTPQPVAGAHDTPRKRRDFWLWQAPPRDHDSSDQASVAIAEADSGTWVTTDDLPKGALRQNEIVVSNVALQISAEGNVQRCSVTVPSGHPDLDSLLCQLMLARGHYTPARDAAGKSVQGVDWKTVRWQLPRR